MIVTLASRFLKIPRIRYYDDFGIVAPRALVRAALDSCAGFDELLRIMLKKKRSEAGPTTEFLGSPIGFRDDRPEVIARMPRCPERIKELTELEPGTGGNGRANYDLHGQQRWAVSEKQLCSLYTN